MPLSHLQDKNEVVELVWENGQIMMQGQSVQARNNIHISKFGEQNLGNSSNIKAGNGLMATILEDFTPTVPSPDFGLDKDDDMAPWLSYNDHFHNNYGSDILPQLSSVTINDHKKNISTPIFDRNQQIASSSAFSNTGSGIINFSHFSRPIALARPNTNNFIGQIPKTMNTTQNIENPGNVLLEDGMRNEAPRQQVEGEKAVEPVVASSSVCSGNNPKQGSDDQNHSLKRNSRETYDSEGPSEDVEEESVGIRKKAPSRVGKGTKRSRAAEVHNLSERRRRDRINEKMRALQELIPHCNKVDKASMLDEAIEYLKTLQLQVQIMSMGAAGLYMPHMMVPGHMAHFQPMMGIGMGMGMGFGMGLDRFHGPRAMPFSRPTNFEMMPGPNLPVYGPHQPLVPISPHLSSHVANPNRV